MIKKEMMEKRQSRRASLQQKYGEMQSADPYSKDYISNLLPKLAVSKGKCCSNCKRCGKPMGPLKTNRKAIYDIRNYRYSSIKEKNDKLSQIRALSAQMKNINEQQKQEEAVSNTLMKSLKKQQLNLEVPKKSQENNFKKLQKPCGSQRLPPLILKKELSHMHYHKNFLILNKKYAKLRAQVILNILGTYLIKRVQQQMRDMFNEKISNGKRLSVEEIMDLRSTFKKDYVKFILNDDNDATEYIGKKHNKIVNIHDHVNHSIYELEDQQDTWVQAVKNISEVIRKRAIEIGMIKELNFEFEEFNIQDMIEPLGVKRCRICAQNLNCPEHQIQKNYKALQSPKLRCV